jgi:hypothetical protein
MHGKIAFDMLRRPAGLRVGGDQRRTCEGAEIVRSYFVRTAFNCTSVSLRAALDTLSPPQPSARKTKLPSAPIIAAKLAQIGFASTEKPRLCRGLFI